MPNRIFLVGLPAAGKTTMGLNLAHHLGIQFADLDQDIERAEGKSVRTIFQEKGEAHFRQLEKLHLEKLIKELDEFVLSTGGGTPCFFSNMELMNSAGKTVWINTSIQEIEKRTSKDHSRPLLQTQSLTELLEKRKSYYKEAQHIVPNYEMLEALFS